MTSNYVLAISGNDIYSGGGLYADLATYTQHQLHGFVAVTCLTAMTEDNGFEVFGTAPDVFAKQLHSLQEVPFAAIKLGLLPTVAVADLALEFVKDHAQVPIILDPVLVCKEGHDLEVTTLRDELVKFFPYATIVTPNLVEAELLSQRTIETVDDMIVAAKILYEMGASSVVIKGGNRLNTKTATDVFYDGQEITILESPLLAQNNIGAGCTFASSITSQIVLGKDVKTAVALAKDYVHQAIQQSDQYGVKQYHAE